MDLFRFKNVKTFFRVRWHLVKLTILYLSVFCLEDFPFYTVFFFLQQSASGEFTFKRVLTNGYYYEADTFSMKVIFY